MGRRKATTTTKTRTRAAGYLRVSTARDGMKADAIYRDQIERYAQAQGLELAEMFQDIGLSGRKGAKRRPQFEDMLTRAEGGEFDSIIVPKLSRFGRSMRDNLAAYDRLEASGVGVVFLDLGVDTSTAAGKFMRNVLSAMAEFESDLISERWKDTHAYLARNGRPSGNATYGYRYDSTTKTMTPNPAQARIVREIFERYDRGEGLRSIARDLERRKIRGLRGSVRWAPSLGYLLDSATYVGLREWDGEMIAATWEPIIDRELWERVQARRVSVRNGHPASNRGTAKAMLGGLLVCGECGGPMWKVGDRYRCARFMRRQGCRSNAIKAEKAEQIVADAFLGRLAEAHRIHATEKGPKVIASSIPADADRISSELARIERKMAALVQMRLESPGAGFDHVSRKMAAELEAHREQLRGELANRVAENRDAEHRAERAAQLLAKVADLPAVWERASTEARREMLGLAIESVRVVRVEQNRKGLEIAWQKWTRA